MHPHRRWAAVSAVLLFVAMMSTSWTHHVDDTDAQLYGVIQRRMAVDHAWLSPHFEPDRAAVFREHLPFGHWPYVAAIHLAGERARVPLAALFALLTVLTTGLLAHRLAGGWAGVAAMAVLGTTERFSTWASTPSLDPPLIFLATLAAMFVLTARSAWAWVGAALALAAAVAIKGPFGLVPFGAAALACLVCAEGRRAKLKVLLLAGGCAVLAVAPIAGFLWAHPDWWQGYALNQVRDSVTGARTDGSLGRGFVFTVIAGRYWPWLPLLAAGVVVAVRPARLLASDRARAACRLLGLAVLVALVGLSLPARKLAHHTWVVFPLLSAFIGVAVGGLLDRLLAGARGKWAAGGLAGLALGVGALAASGVLTRFWYPPCVVEGAFKAGLASAAEGEGVFIVPREGDFGVPVQLAYERRLLPLQVEALPASGQARLAIVWGEKWPVPGWRSIAEGRGYVLAERE